MLYKSGKQRKFGDRFEGFSWKNNDFTAANAADFHPALKLDLNILGVKKSITVQYTVNSYLFALNVATDFERTCNRKQITLDVSIAFCTSRDGKLIFNHKVASAREGARNAHVVGFDVARERGRTRDLKGVGTLDVLTVTRSR